jgi:hypothetical protein
MLATEVLLAHAARIPVPGTGESVKPIRLKLATFPKVAVRRVVQGEGSAEGSDGFLPRPWKAIYAAYKPTLGC